jgi:hypothetical protein
MRRGRGLRIRSRHESLRVAGRLPGVRARRAAHSQRTAPVVRRAIGSDRARSKRPEPPRAQAGHRGTCAGGIQQDAASAITRPALGFGVDAGLTIGLILKPGAPSFLDAGPANPVVFQRLDRGRECGKASHRQRAPSCYRSAAVTPPHAAPVPRSAAGQLDRSPPRRCDRVPAG